MEKEKQTKKAESNISCSDEKCPIHGSLKSRGRIFFGIVRKKFDKRIVIDFERVVYVPKYERYTKTRTKLHARLPACIKVELGDYVKIQECRPLSKIIHFVTLENLGKQEIKK